MTQKPPAGRGPELTWFKSSYSDSSNINDCVEVALEWVKSSYSSSNNGEDCVEAAIGVGAIHIRDSKNRQGAQLAFASRAWRDFVAGYAIG
ncbi:DUF397 domain-containing protein [Streptomyces spectabilis]|uniref:DUF397 domain-containing protein n=1 Tax=Streptomyces spectabilis TaxID=68270 RepID=A0A5P2XAG8_STRST|nr:DUF397 domain-containing protein [Streptomyces spectabilis]MBB5106415.1 hypothetical protein [Streptomyces spectabilis]MCI3903024.1 DUF397 domain-containing protein [Streptomyces spectabilis]QEV60279.1 DUF397 domain-containing protein [Streptomyces spectabilis]GGV32833.1 toxin [Streptomyces spectabilis]